MAKAKEGGPGVYRILKGKHILGRVKLTRSDPGKPIIVGGDTGIDVFESPADLTHFNSIGSTKFQWLGPTGSVDGAFKLEEPDKPIPVEEINPDKLEGEVSSDDKLASMTVQELRNFAAEEEIDLGSATKRDDILRVIKGALAIA